MKNEEERTRGALQSTCDVRKKKVGHWEEGGREPESGGLAREALRGAHRSVVTLALSWSPLIARGPRRGICSPAATLALATANRGQQETNSMMSPGRLTLITHRHTPSVTTSITCQPVLSQVLARKHNRDKDGSHITSAQCEAERKSARGSRERCMGTRRADGLRPRGATD